MQTITTRIIFALALCAACGGSDRMFSDGVKSDPDGGGAPPLDARSDAPSPTGDERDTGLPVGFGGVDGAIDAVIDLSPIPSTIDAYTADAEGGPDAGPDATIEGGPDGAVDAAAVDAAADVHHPMMIWPGDQPTTRPCPDRCSALGLAVVARSECACGCYPVAPGTPGYSAQLSACVRACVSAGYAYGSCTGPTFVDGICGCEP